MVFIRVSDKEVREQTRFASLCTKDKEDKIESESSRKHTVMYSDRMQVKACLGYVS